MTLLARLERAGAEVAFGPTRPARGTRLTPERVVVIKSRALAARAARAALVDSDRELAREFSCSIDTVRKIATGVRWNPDAPKRRHR